MYKIQVMTSYNGFSFDNNKTHITKEINIDKINTRSSITLCGRRVCNINKFCEMQSSFLQVDCKRCQNSKAYKDFISNNSNNGRVYNKEILQKAIDSTRKDLEIYLDSTIKNFKTDLDNIADKSKDEKEFANNINLYLINSFNRSSFKIDSAIKSINILLKRTDKIEIKIELKAMIVNLARIEERLIEIEKFNMEAANETNNIS